MANQVRLSYYLSGKSGPQVVLIHGLGGSAQATYGPVIERLAREFRVLAFDNRGVGGSEAPAGPYALSDFARDTYELMQSQHIARAHIVGHSLGGTIAQQFALMYPDATLSLVLADSPGRMTAAGNAGFEQRAATVEAGGTGAIVEAVLKNGIGPQAKERYPELVERFRRELLASPAGPYAASARAMVGHDVLDRLTAFRGPALVIRGDQDGAFSQEAGEELAGAFAHGRFAEIADSGHNTPFENPDAFATLVAQFVREAAGAARE